MDIHEVIEWRIEQLGLKPADVVRLTPGIPQSTTYVYMRSLFGPWSTPTGRTLPTHVGAKVVEAVATALRLHSIPRDMTLTVGRFDLLTTVAELASPVTEVPLTIWEAIDAQRKRAGVTASQWAKKMAGDTYDPPYQSIRKYLVGHRRGGSGARYTGGSSRWVDLVHEKAGLQLVPLEWTVRVGVYQW